MFNEYKSSPDRKKMVQIAAYKRCPRYIIVCLTSIALFSLVVWFATFSTRNDVHDIVSFGIITSVSCIFGIILIVTGCLKYSITFKHKYMALPTYFSSSIILFLYIYPFIYICNYMNLNRYMYVFAPSCIFIATVYYVINAKLVIVKNFHGLYFIVNNSIFFDQQKYEEFKNYIPYIHYQICMAFLTVAAIIGLYSKSAIWGAGASLSIGLCSLCFAFLCYPNFIHAAYMLFVVHPRVEKKFNQLLLSDQWGLIEQNPDLAEKFWGGPNPVKRPIQYEEIFPPKQKT